MIKCSCLCEKIEFDAEEIPGMVFNCHCSRCRKSHGAAFSTQVIAIKDSLKFHKGREVLKEYRAPTATRAFCSQCGSRLMNSDSGHENYLSISVSAINNLKDFKLAGECFVNEKLGFVVLDDSIPHHEKLPQI